MTQSQLSIKWIVKPWNGLKLGVIGLIVFILGFNLEEVLPAKFGTIILVLGWIILIIGIVGHVIWFFKKSKNG